MALLLLGSVVGETVASSNTPVVVYFIHPWVLLFLVVSYGCPVLLMREAWARRWVSWPGALLLGAAYAAFNEGIIADTWYRADALGFTPYRLGRVDGVNWCLIMGLCVFHTFASLGMPIGLLHLWRGDDARQPWLRTRGVWIAALPPAAVIALIALAPDADHRARAVTALAIALAVLVAPRLSNPGVGTLRRCPSERMALVVGVGLGITFLLSFLLVPVFIGVAAVALLLVQGVVTARYVVRAAGTAAWSDRHWTALIAGALTPSLLVSLLQIATLQPVATAATIAGLVAIDRRVGGRAAPAGPRAAA